MQPYGNISNLDYCIQGLRHRVSEIWGLGNKCDGQKLNFFGKVNYIGMAGVTAARTLRKLGINDVMVKHYILA